MTQAGIIVKNIMSQAWIMIMALIVLIAFLGMLAQVFKGASGALLGTNLWVAEAVAGVLGILVVVLFGFMGLPAIVRAASVGTVGGSCGPISEVGQFAGSLIGAIGGIRMAIAVFQAVASAAVGGSGGMSTALTEMAETVFGMLLITVAAPVAAAFFGVC